MALAESAVAYDGLPISSGGAHGLGQVTARDALHSWLAFLDACTESSAVNAWFDFPDTPELKVQPEVERHIHRAFPGRGRCTVPWARADEALALFESLEPLPANRWGMAPIWLWFTADFRILRPNSSEIWPGQDTALFGGFVTPGGTRLGASSTRLILQARKTIGLSISIPNVTDADLEDMLPWLQNALPMKLSSKHWSRWTRTTSGTSYRGQKLTPAL